VGRTISLRNCYNPISEGRIFDVRLCRLRKGIKLKFWHRVFNVLGYKRATVCDEHGGDGGVLKRECLASFRIAPL
jgi:hypothetical protein